MGLTDSEIKFSGRLIAGEEGIKLPLLYNYYEKIVNRRHSGLEIKNCNLEYSFGKSTPKRFRFMEVRTADISKIKSILMMRTGIHGEERFSVAAFALAFPEVAAYAKEKRVGLISWVAANPWGLSTWKRYNPEYYKLEERGEPFDGNDDALRYQVDNGRWVSNLNGRRPAEVKWEWADKIMNRLPVETQFMLDRTRDLVEKGLIREGKEDDGPKIRAVLDGHNDHITEDEHEEASDGMPRKCCYTYRFPNGRHYQKIIKKAARFVPVARSREIDSGDGGVARLNNYGEATKFQGSWAELMWRLGVLDCIILECRQGDDLPEDKEATLAWAKGLIDLIAKD